MVKAKVADRPKGQPTLTSFLKKTTSKDEEEVANTFDRDASDAEDVPEQETNAKINNKLPPDQSDLPPINEIPAIFADLVDRLPNVKSLVERVKGRKLRIATMCSGTESPLLALGLISRSLKEKYGLIFEFEHVFSCEIEPFKQAYIERNFKPPILFRDVCELGNEYAYVFFSPLPHVCSFSTPELRHTDRVSVSQGMSISSSLVLPVSIIRI